MCSNIRFAKYMVLVHMYRTPIHIRAWKLPTHYPCFCLLVPVELLIHLNIWFPLRTKISVVYPLLLYAWVSGIFREVGNGFILFFFNNWANKISEKRGVEKLENVKCDLEANSRVSCSKPSFCRWFGEVQTPCPRTSSYWMAEQVIDQCSFGDCLFDVLKSFGLMELGPKASCALFSWVP